MDSYNRAYRDPKSPLTPLTPLATNCAFNFNLNGDNSVSNAVRPSPQQQNQRNVNQPQMKYSVGFAKLRAVFEKPRTEIANRCCSPNCLVVPHTNEKPINTPVKSVLLKVPAMRNGAANGTYTPQKTPQLKCVGVMQKTPFSNLRNKHHNNNKNNNNNKRIDAAKVGKQKFKQASPIAIKALSPRVACLLKKTGLTQYKGLFQREEIDMSIFRTLTTVELQILGIQSAEDRGEMSKAILLAKKLFKF